MRKAPEGLASALHLRTRASLRGTSCLRTGAAGPGGGAVRRGRKEPFLPPALTGYLQGRSRAPCT